MTHLTDLTDLTDTDFEPWLSLWGLEREGRPALTRSGRFLPVRYEGVPAMLKVVTEPEERDGVETMVWWRGESAARVLARHGDGHVLERARGGRSLVALARADDDEATAILCGVAARLHAKEPSDRPATVVPLAEWFRELWPAARRHGGLLATAAATAEPLLAQQLDPVVLHGDLHHENVLDFGVRGWLAIDPKGLYGERTFDFVNLLRNPYAELALAPGRFGAQVEVIASLARIDVSRLLRWTLAFTGLSAAWILNDGDEPTLDLEIARMAQAALAGRSPNEP